MTDAPSQPRARFGETSVSRGTPGFGSSGLIIGIVAVVVVVGGLLWSAAAGHATAASHPELIGGSIVLDSTRPLTVVNRATGEATVQLDDVYLQVGASNDADVEAVPVDGGTMLVNTVTGAFNLLQADNYVVDTTGAGVGLGALAGSRAAAGYSDGADAYIVRSGPHSTISRVGASTVQQASSQAAGGTAGAASDVVPLGFASLKGTVPDTANATVVGNGELWTLLEGAKGCSLVSLSPVAKSGNLAEATRARPRDCARAALGSAGGVVALATPGHLALFRPGHAKALEVNVTATTGASSLRAVSGSSSTLWYLADDPTGWQLLGVGPTGAVQGPHTLHGIGVAASPAPPVFSNGRIYTLDRQASGQPALWVIDPTSGAVGTLGGIRTYPADGRTEQASFSDADMLVSGPRVVYNNPGSLLAVVVFTDGTHAPVIVNKKTAVNVSAAGPASVNTSPTAKSAAPPGSSSAAAKTPSPPSVSQTVNCANTTQKPYAPSDVAVTPSAESAQVNWTYQLLDEQDCQPQSWSVTVTAVAGADQPADPVQTVDGQQQLDFTGLRPSTAYEAVVTAYINHQSTSSTPTTFTTSAQAADPPASVTATVDAAGDWVVSWTPCELATCYTPAARWIVTGTACGGSYVGSPPSMEVAGGTTTATFSAVALDRLGQSLSFSVQGVSAQDLPGNPVSDKTCLQSWRPPQQGAISLATSGAATAGGTIAATLQVSPPLSDTAVYGSASTELQYEINGQPEGGPTTATQLVIPNLAPNTSYQPSVIVMPVGHTSSAVTVTGAPIHKDLQWNPSLAMSAALTAGAGTDNGVVTATVSALGPGSFDASGQLACGEISQSVDAGVTAEGQVQIPISLVTFGGSCSVTLTLTDTTSPDPYGTPSDQISADFDLGSSPTFDLTDTYSQSDCSVDTLENYVCTTTFSVAPTPNAPALAGINWAATATASGPGIGGSPGPHCDQSSPTQSAPPTGSAPIVITATGCPQFSTSVQPTVTVTWQYLGQTVTAAAKNTGTNGPPPPTTTTTTTTTTPAPSTTTTTTVAHQTTTAAVSSDTSPTALVAATAPAAPVDPAGERSLEVLLGTVALAGIAVSITTRRRRRRSRSAKGAA